MGYVIFREWVLVSENGVLENGVVCWGGLKVLFLTRALARNFTRLLREGWVVFTTRESLPVVSISVLRRRIFFFPVLIDRTES